MGRYYNIHVPPGYEVGWLVPEKMRNRWTLILGDSKKELPKLLNSFDVVDVFFHDSLHTEEHILFELESVFPKLRRGCYLLADDVNEYWSLAFVDFCKKHRLPCFVFGSQIGIAKKE